MALQEALWVAQRQWVANQVKGEVHLSINQVVLCQVLWEISSSNRVLKVPWVAHLEVALWAVVLKDMVQCVGRLEVVQWVARLAVVLWVVHLVVGQWGVLLAVALWMVHLEPDLQPAAQ